ncbi:MAG: hypothetical protein QW231_06355 [Candidatus Bathyarchaeia archaeon]
MSDEFIKGVNYWPIESAMNWWQRFDPSVVRDDFSRIQETGLRGVRIFLLWEAFQPLPRKISVKVLDELVAVMEIGHETKLKMIPTFFTGHMSGINYLPVWMLESKESNGRFPVFSEGKVRKNAIRNFYIDREAIEAQKLFLREVSGALKGHPALWAWDLGNEPSNLVLPPSSEQALVWLEEMVSELKNRDESVPVTLGLHQEDLEEDRKMGPKEVARFCDFLSIHTYSLYAKWADGSLDEKVSPFLGLLTQWLGSKKVLIEEVGIPSSNVFGDGDRIVSEDRAFEYYERLLQKLARFPFLGVFFWCYGDYAKSLWDQVPFSEQKHERFFGLFREDRSPKAFVSLFESFGKGRALSDVPWDWVDIEAEEYFKSPETNLLRLYRRFRDQSF